MRMFNAYAGRHLHAASVPHLTRHLSASLPPLQSFVQAVSPEFGTAGDKELLTLDFLPPPPAEEAPGREPPVAVSGESGSLC